MRKTILVLVSSLLLIFLLLGACNSESSPATSSESTLKPALASKTYTNDVYKFSTEYPENWNVTDNLTQDESAHRVLVKFGSATATITIEADQWPNSTLEQYAAAVEIQVLKKSLPDYVSLQEEKTTISGVPAIMRVFTATFGGSPNKYAQVYFIKADFAYAITYASILADYDASFNCLELVMGTFEFG